MTVTDFTLKKYRELLDAILRAYPRVFRMDRYLEEKPAPDGVCLIRHDVDRAPGRALDMARAEKEMGVASTYYFRVRKPAFDPPVIAAVEALGHEVGYHYEDLALARGDVGEALRRFESNLSLMRTIATVRTLAMHGSPLSPWDNRSLWDRHDFGRFGILGEAYLSIDYDTMPYVTDTGRSWDPGRFNVRDRVCGAVLTGVDSTDRLIARLVTDPPRNLCVVAHPNRWTDRPAAWVVQFASDWIVNVGKAGYVFFRRGMRWR